ncbi:MAG: class I SAM-dependent methyltransferase [Croceibacterium sp.]
MNPIYDRIGTGYSIVRRTDPRIAAQIEAGLGDARTVVNVGAGSGSYEPAEREVTAVEPSREMINQRGPGAAQAIQAHAEELPFADNSFDAAMAVLTVHHWTDQIRGLEELRRVARDRVVVLTFEHGHPGTWLGDYLPALRKLDAGQTVSFDVYRKVLGPLTVAPVLVPADCIDGFLYAYWQRPEAYLDPQVRAGSSSFRVLSGVEPGLERLARDLASGEWKRRYSYLLELPACDAGYRLVIAQSQ